jgi:hypothetical protein
LAEPDAGAGDDKHDKNRLHLDLRTADLEREVARIVGLDPSLLTDHPVIEHRWRWHILADPDGTELCPAAVRRQPRTS